MTRLRVVLTVCAVLLYGGALAVDPRALRHWMPLLAAAVICQSMATVLGRKRVP